MRDLIQNLRRNGYALMILSTFMFSAASLFVKLASRDYSIPVFELVFFRSFINAILILIISVIRRESLSGNDKPLLILRSILGFAALSAFFYSISTIKYANAVILTYTSPIFAAIFGAMLLREKINPMFILKVIAALTGAAMVIKPSIEMMNPGGLWGVLSAVLAALAYVSVRKLSRNNNWATIIFYFTLISTILSFPLMLNNFVMPCPAGFTYLVLIGVLSTFGQIFMTKAYKFLEASKGTLVSLFSIVISIFLSFLVLDEDLGLYTLLGGLLVFIGTGGMAFLKPIFFHEHPNRNF